MSRCAGLAETPNLLDPVGDSYVATRGAAGWASAATTPPAAGLIVRWAGGYAAARSFSPDFSRWLQIAASKEQVQRGESRAFQGGLGGLFSPLSPPLVPLAGSVPSEDLPKLVETRSCRARRKTTRGFTSKSAREG